MQIDTLVQAAQHLDATLEAADLPSRDARGYRKALAILSRMNLRAQSPGTAGEAAEVMRTAMEIFSLQLLMAAALIRGMSYNRLRKAAADGDLAGLLGARDVEACLADAFMAFVPDDLAARLRQERDAAEHRQAAQAACGAGCWFCCATHTMIDATPAEAVAVWQAVQESTTPAHTHPRACPALGADGLCRAYDVRPAACRKRASNSVASCRADLENGPGKTPAHVLQVFSPFGAQSTANAFAALLGVKAPNVNLLTTLRAARRGDRLPEAIAKGRRAARRYDDSKDPEIIPLPPA